MNTLKFEDVEPGKAIPPLEHRPTAVQLFRFSAATWNSHRIHYDQAYAAAEGYPDVLVQSHLHGAFLLRMVTRWAGPHARVRKFAWQNRHYAVPGDVLTCTGTVEETFLEDGAGLVRCSLEERNQDDIVCAPGWAIIELPRHETTDA